MTIQITKRIGRALEVSSATRLKDLDQALREFIRSVGPGATVPLTGSFPWASLTGVPATFPPSAHTHPNGDLTGYTAADVLSKLLTVDGTGSGLDADLLDGLNSTAFATAPTTGTWTPSDGSGAGLAITVTEATYVRNVNLVMARTHLQYPVTADASLALISGLPFALAAGSANRQAWITWSNVAALRYAQPQAGGSGLRFSDNAGALLTNAQLSGGTMWFTALYSA